MSVIKPELKIQLGLIEVIKARNSRSLPRLEKGYKMGEIANHMPITLLSNNVKGQLY